MTTVLLVEDDPAFRGAIARDLMRYDIEVATAESVDQATELLRERAFDILVTDLRLSDRDGIDLLAAAREIARGTRTILMSAYASARDYKTAVELGAVRVLCKPFTPKELLDAIWQAAECTTGFHGSFHGMSLVDILQMLHLGLRSVTVEVRGLTPARIHVHKGEIVHAEHGDLVGEEALRETLSARSGAISTKVLEEVPRTITRTFDMLILDSLRALDEASTPRSGTDGDLVFTLSDFPAPMSLPATSSEPFDARCARKWRQVELALGGVSSSAVAVASDLATGEAVILRGDIDALELAAELRRIATTVASIAGDGPILMDALGDIGIGVVRQGDLVMALLDVLSGASSPSWFRSQVATLGRCVLSEEGRSSNGKDR